MNNKDSNTKKPWPTKAAMQQVYAENLWGGEEGTYFSGAGSHDEKLVKPYVAAVTTFLKSFNPPLVVCDLGCGDFNVGSQLVPFAKRYIAVDIVADLIAYNQERFTDENVQFQCLDLAMDDLPNGDCVIVRQVLQHLSNTEVQAIASKLSQYQYVILTEHIPEGEFVPNKDIISGQGIRLKKQSGVDLEAPPFNFAIQKEKQLLSLLLPVGKGRITTVLYQVF